VLREWKWRQSKNPEQAKALFLQAWYELTNDFEKFTTTLAKQKTNSCSE
jgi:hypothetical protein